MHIKDIINPSKVIPDHTVNSGAIDGLTALWLLRIVEAVDTGIIALNNLNIITVCNSYAMNVLGLDRQVIGRDITYLFRHYPVLESIYVGNCLSDEVLNVDNITLRVRRKPLSMTKEDPGLLIIINTVEPALEFTENIELNKINNLTGSDISTRDAGDPKDNLTLRQLQLMKECNIIANSKKMLTLLDLCYKIAQFDTTVLIQGESGVGKESIARFIYRASKRYDTGKFIAVNCGAFSKDLIISELFGYESGAFTGAKKEGKPGLFELANRGTLFLDEIAELPYDFQVKFLRVLQEQQYIRLGGTKNIKVDVRILAASNHVMQQLVDSGKFRSDLFYRLNVININVPALRERREDIAELVQHFLNMYNTKYQMIKLFSDETLDIMKSYSWPGNVRELSNLVERLVLTISENIVQPKHLPESFFTRANKDNDLNYWVLPLPQAIEKVEKEMIVRALNMYGSTYKAAKVLGVSQSTVARKARKYCSEINHLND